MFGYDQHLFSQIIIWIWCIYTHILYVEQTLSMHDSWYIQDCVTIHKIMPKHISRMVLRSCFTRIFQVPRVFLPSVLGFCVGNVIHGYLRCYIHQPIVDIGLVTVLESGVTSPLALASGRGGLVDVWHPHGLVWKSGIQTNDTLPPLYNHIWQWVSYSHG